MLGNGDMVEDGLRVLVELGTSVSKDVGGMVSACCCGRPLQDEIASAVIAMTRIKGIVLEILYIMRPYLDVFYWFSYPTVWMCH
jgi:hypothetical protein